MAENRLDFWKRKARARAEKSFGGGKIVEYSWRILDRLHAETPTDKVEGADLKAIAQEFDVPLKFVMRALASTIGVVRLEAGKDGPIRVVLQRDKLAGGKASAGLVRGPISSKLRARLLEADRNACSSCGSKGGSLAIDHIIPLSLLGADEPGNWAALCRGCNRDKFQNLRDDFLKRYRGERVTEPIGARFKEGRLWPRINGKIRHDRRQDWEPAS